MEDTISPLGNPTLTRPSPTLSRNSSHDPSSRPRSLFQAPGTPGGVDDMSRTSMVIKFLYRRLQEQGWLQSDPDAAGIQGILGVVMRVEQNSSVQYISEPGDADPNLKKIAEKLKLAVMFTMSADVTGSIFSRLSKDDTEVTLVPNNVTVPVVNSLHELATSDNGVRRRDFICLVRQERVVLVWSHAAEDIMLQGSDVESKLMSTIWGAVLPERPRQSMFHAPSRPMSVVDMPINHRHPMRALDSTKTSVIGESIEIDEKGGIVINESDLEIDDEESLKIPPRPFLLTHSVMIGLAMGLLVLIECLSVRAVVVEVKALGKPALPRLALLATIPIFMWFTVFFTVVLVQTCFQAFGPIGDVKSGNSRFYSSRAPDRKRHQNLEFPHITIQMPVYKEGLKGVIIPTVTSLMAAIAHYEKQGGTASIYVCEDGMQAVKPELAEARKRFYEANNIGWCARPAHGQDGFVRRGKFKKASNMNYCLSFSLRVEDELLRLMKEKADRTDRSQEDFSIEEENELYDQAVATILESDGGKTWAAGNVRMGEIILIVDCDTRVPIDCLSLGAMEMAESPEVAILQHASGVMQVINSVFENAITYFTNLVYTSISFSVGSGDCAPFVGHNAFLRWKSIQSVSFVEDGKELFWSESHVSEDFDMSLRLQTAGFVVRYATYDKGEFKEGVSLTAFDELLRWEKYAYGCSELIFHPVYQWIYKGPFTGLFCRFLWSNMKVSAKFTVLGYIGTYYAIGAALPMSLLNYFITGWIANDLDHFYLPSWDMLVGTLFIFLIASPFAFAWFRHRVGNANFFWALFEAYKWMPFFAVFFGGISWHVSYSLLAHMFCLPIEWSSTAKELESGGFFVSMNRVWKTFKWTILFMIPLIGGMIYLAQFAPTGWRISDFTSIVPLANQIGGHLLLPLFTIMF